MSSAERTLMSDPMAVAPYQPAPPSSEFPFKPVRALLQQPGKTNWLIRPMLEKGSLAVVFGEPAAGKSFLVLCMAAAIASGKQWYGCSVQQGAVFVIAGEGHSGFAQRMKALEVVTGWDIAAAPIFFSERAAALIELEGAVAVANAVASLVKLHGPPALVIIDTLHRNLGGGNENSAEDVGKCLSHIDTRIRAQFGCAVLIVHHSGHMDKDRARGSSALRAAVDHEYCLRVRDDLRVLECTKSKEHESPEPIAFVLKSVILPWIDEETGENRRGAVLDKVGTPAIDLKKPKLSRQQRIAHEALRAAIKLHPDRAAAAQPGYPASFPSQNVTEERWFEQAMAQGISSSELPSSVRKAFNRAKAELLEKGLIEQWGSVFAIADKSDKTGHVSILSATMSGQTGHTSLEVSCLSDGPDSLDDDEVEL